MTIADQSFCGTPKFQSFGGGKWEARSCAGNLFVVGKFLKADGEDAYNSAVLRGNTLESYFEGEDPRMNGEIWTSIMYKGKLYTGGAGKGGLNVLNKTTKNWDIVGGGAGTGFQTVFDMTIWNGLLCFVGNFDDYDGIAHTARVCAWDGTNIVPLQSNRFAPNLSMAGNVTNIINFQGDLIITGQFSLRIADVEQGSDGEFYAKYIGGAVGSAWTPFGPEYVRGLGILATYDGKLWSRLSNEIKALGGPTFTTTGIPYGVFAIDGDLWACGDMSVVDGVNVDRVAKYNAVDGWVAVGDGLPARVYCVFKYKNEIYIAGQFFKTVTVSPLTVARGIAKLDEANNKWVKVSDGDGLNSNGWGYWMIEENA